jgi:enoyl-CoA hydratase
MRHSEEEQMSEALVLVEKQDAVTTILINRPEARNAVNRATADALVEAFLDFERDDSQAVAVLAGNGGYFCAGADLKAVSTGVANRMESVRREDLDASGPMGPSRLLLSKPVIAAIEGFAVAGGLELACWADLRVMAEDAQFGVFCRRWGVPLIDGGTVRLPRLIGHSRALDLVLTGRPVKADEAERIGLANRVVASGEALAAAQSLALELSRFPQDCLRADRYSIFAQEGETIHDAMYQEFERGRKVVESGAAAAGAERFAGGKGRGGDFGDI